MFIKGPDIGMATEGTDISGQEGEIGYIMKTILIILPPIICIDRSLSQHIQNRQCTLENNDMREVTGRNQSLIPYFSKIYLSVCTAYIK